MISKLSNSREQEFPSKAPSQYSDRYTLLFCQACQCCLYTKRSYRVVAFWDGLATAYNRFTRPRSIWRGARASISIGVSDHWIIGLWDMLLFFE